MILVDQWSSWSSFDWSVILCSLWNLWHPGGFYLVLGFHEVWHSCYLLLGIGILNKWSRTSGHSCPPRFDLLEKQVTPWVRWLEPCGASCIPCHWIPFAKGHLGLRETNLKLGFCIVGGFCFTFLHGRRTKHASLNFFIRALILLWCYLLPQSPSKGPQFSPCHMSVRRHTYRHSTCSPGPHVSRGRAQPCFFSFIIESPYADV